MTSPFPDARTDSLTGLYSRRFFEETLSREVARADRYRSSLTMLMLDVDHFKEVNDAHGHVVGNDVLKAVAKITSLIAEKSRLRVQDPRR
jgi:two-component system cell cycle response regulator